MTRKSRQFALFLLMGICFACFAAPRTAWCQESKPGQKEENPTRELVYKTINFAILIGALGYLLRKPAAEFFSSRAATIKKSLDEGREALEASQARLKDVEGKLARLESEIAAFKASALSEMASERERLKQASAEEAARMLEATRGQTEMMVRAAKLELKKFAADKSVNLAEEMIRTRLDDSAQRRLVTQFVSTMEPKDRQN